MSRIRIDDLPMGENLTPEEEELILGAGRQTFRPTLESLENREMMDAGIGGALMHPLPNLGQGAQIRLLAQETSAAQNQNNPLSQSLTHPGQTLLAQGQQLNANLHAAADCIFSAWTHNVEQVVQNVLTLQHVANRMLASTMNGLNQGHNLNQNLNEESVNQLEKDRPQVQQTAVEDFMNDAVKNGRLDNPFSFRDVKESSSYVSGNTITVRLKVTYGIFTEKTETVELRYEKLWVYGNSMRYTLNKVTTYGGGGDEQLLRETLMKGHSWLIDVGQYPEKAAVAALNRRLDSLIQQNIGSSFETDGKFIPIDASGAQLEYRWHDKHYNRDLGIFAEVKYEYTDRSGGVHLHVSFQVGIVPDADTNTRQAYDELKSHLMNLEQELVIKP